MLPSQSCQAAGGRWGNSAREAIGGRSASAGKSHKTLEGRAQLSLDLAWLGSFRRLPLVVINLLALSLAVHAAAPPSQRQQPSQQLWSCHFWLQFVGNAFWEIIFYLFTFRLFALSGSLRGFS